MFVSSLLVFGVAVIASPHPRPGSPFDLFDPGFYSQNPCIPGFNNYQRILATCIEQPELDWSRTPPWTTCTPVKSGDGHNTRACDLEFGLGRLEDVCVKYGCMDNVPESMTKGSRSL
ncbi:hypothetical protein BU23DRAFT_647989 [Bimuria novae-zelandiae CBS 107.79]|uniref:Uncharacterized protein n=1 Tax=Bimuria novae-zelandiae CBS 107.79 TaxID=1447943 RepID=A0A6A5V209_9PLEO|nr:hypothetical protein BU23DRAFT_647989 [Bimuria novae-zelandiae CBS 107.79]